MKLKLFLSSLLLLMSLSANADSAGFKKRIAKSVLKQVNIVIKAQGFYPVLHNGKMLKLKKRKYKSYKNGIMDDSFDRENKLMLVKGFFKDQEKRKIVVNFVVTKVAGDFQIIQPIIHTLSGERQKYNLKH